MLDGFFRVSNDGINDMARGYVRNLKKWGRDCIIHEWRLHHDVYIVNSNFFTNFLYTFGGELFNKFVTIRPVKLDKQEISNRIDVLCNDRIKHDSLNSFLSVSRKYGDVYMSIDVYKSIMEIVNYDGTKITCDDRLKKIRGQM